MEFLGFMISMRLNPGARVRCVCKGHVISRLWDPVSQPIRGLLGFQSHVDVRKQKSKSSLVLIPEKKSLSTFNLSRLLKAGVHFWGGSYKLYGWPCGKVSNTSEETKLCSEPKKSDKSIPMARRSFNHIFLILETFSLASCECCLNAESGKVKLIMLILHFNLELKRSKDVKWVCWQE